MHDISKTVNPDRMISQMNVLSEYSLPPIEGIDISLWDNKVDTVEDGLWSPTFLFE